MGYNTISRTLYIMLEVSHASEANLKFRDDLASVIFVTEFGPRHRTRLHPRYVQVTIPQL
jgi:hypothetical protein